MKTAFLVGAGAVENAWGPVYLALRDVYGDFPMSAATSMFASIVYELRWWHLPDMPVEQPARRDQLLAQYRQLRERVGFRLREARETGAIRTRDALGQIIQEFVTSPAYFATTNWDLTLVDYLESKFHSFPTPVFLHGTCEEGQPLYLPSETIEEPYRTHDEKQHLGRLHTQTLEYFENCDRLVVYGLSMDPLDAELGVVVIGSLVEAQKLREVVVLDMNPRPVVERLRALLLNIKPNPRFEGRAIVPNQRSNYRIVRDRAGFQLGSVFYDRSGYPTAMLPPEFASTKSRELKRRLRAMAKAANKQILNKSSIGKPR